MHKGHPENLREEELYWFKIEVPGEGKTIYNVVLHGTFVEICIINKVLMISYQSYETGNIDLIVWDSILEISRTRITV